MHRALALVALAACSKAPDYEAPAVAIPAKPPACATSSGAADVDLGGARAIAIAAGEDRACALLEDRGVMCWGDDMFELPGDGPARSAKPERIPTSPHAVELALGEYAGCTRAASGALHCWRKADATLGPLAASPHETPTTGSIAIGLSHTCVIKGGGVVCSGSLIGSGSFGKGLRVPGVSSPIAIGVGAYFGCALEAGGTAACWGEGFNRYEGPVHAKRVAGIAGATQVAVSNFDGCVVTAEGGVTCWTPSRTNQPFAVEGMHGARRIALAEEDGCAVTDRGTVACWNTDDADQPVRAVGVPGLADAVDIALGRGFRCALRANGHVRCWGANDKRQLGIETLMRSEQPVTVCNLNRVVEVATGDQHACALRDSGDMYCWGANHDGQLDGASVANGTRTTIGGSTTHRAAPARVPLSATIAHIAAYGETTCALDVTGHVACWGRNPFTMMTVGPSAFVVPTEPVTSIALGGDGLCAVTRAGKVTCNGVEVPGIANATRVRMRGLACADLAGGGLACWGTWYQPGIRLRGGGHAVTATTLVTPLVCPNAPCGWTPKHELVCHDGDSMTADHCTPLTSAQLDAALAPRGNLVCKATTDGLVTCAGYNSFGQLGIGKMGWLMRPDD